MTLHYAAKAFGEHTLPVQLMVTDGRRVRLDLSARCVPAAQPCGHLPGAAEPGKDGTLVLAPVAIGAEHPPLQMWSLRNAGAEAMQWAVDLSPLTELCKQNWGYARL